MSRCSDTKSRLLAASLDLIRESGYGATSVEQICERAGVKKGSFYHFFQSKSDLAVAALEMAWEAKRAALEEIFNADVPPLERLERFGRMIVEKQIELKERTGLVCGCPWFCVGSEVGAQDEPIRAKVQEILGCHLGYYESAIRDAEAAGLISPGDAAARACDLHRYAQGALTEARILNDLTPIHELTRGWMAMLGVETAAPASSSGNDSPASAAA